MGFQAIVIGAASADTEENRTRRITSAIGWWSSHPIALARSLVVTPTPITPSTSITRVSLYDDGAGRHVARVVTCPDGDGVRSLLKRDTSNPVLRSRRAAASPAV